MPFFKGTFEDEVKNYSAALSREMRNTDLSTFCYALQNYLLFNRAKKG